MSKISGWKLMGESATHDHVAGVLPASGMHFLVAPNDDERRAIVADMCVAIASGNIGTLVQDGKKLIDGWRLESGFLGLDVGEQNGVAIIEAAGHTDVKTAAAFRGVKSNLPIAISTAPKSDIVSARLHDLRYEMNVGLVIVAADWSRGIDEVRRILNYRNSDFAVLVVSATEPPATMVKDETRVLRVADRSLSLAHPATVTPWSRSFGLEAISINGERAWCVRAGAEAVMVPEFAPAVQEPAPAAPEPYAGTVICWRSVFGLHPLEAERWPEGARFAEQPYDAARVASEIEGRVQIIIALGPESKLAPQEERRRIRTACEQFKIAGRVHVAIASRTLLDARDVKDRIAPAA